ncbi:MAG: MBL fold metallo-hydrolase, partial [Gammaproteobacteria bacterium]|nr:MBL fold metallo-hydrolase [Gammaproteobacteria bacterium]
MAYRVVKSGSKYAVKKDGAQRASKTFTSKSEADDYCDKMNGVSKVERVVKKVAKKKGGKTLIVVVAILLLALAVTGFILWKKGIIKFPSKKKTDTLEGVIYDDFQIHFMMLGNDKAGDSIYIKAGDQDILIDAGSNKGSASTLKEYINKYCTDGKLEYVIATHGDSDHISAFCGNEGIFKSYECKTIIDFEYTTKNTAIYNEYVTLRDEEVASGAKHYYASQCWNNIDGAQRVYQLSDKVTMKIIYNKYYFELSDDENNHSVCTLFTYTNNGEEHNFLLTGDLEKKGEESVAAYYDKSTKEKTLPTVDLFKAGHHGSKTSSNDCLLSIIKPQICVVSCCCGTDEYTGNTDNQFPTQDFINRIAKYTDKVYITSMLESYTIETATGKTDSNGIVRSSKTGVEVNGQYIHSSGFKPMNGNIIISIGAENKVGIAASN